ncbi:LGFP repeat-containing protein [Gordonia sp. (in: high G+C Gram-positive bacteria)]|uniref:LGFP repeat-containing protein n=1 Tax=Gordonia sp. (in: high G+C Gram-positive bacteria) TaxID=84139 RepID=UPI0039E679C8
MNVIGHRRSIGIVVGLGAVALLGAGCASETATAPTSSQAGGYDGGPSSAYYSAASSSAPAWPARPVRLKAADGTPVILIGPIAAKYTHATPAQKKDLGLPLSGDHNSGKRANGLVFQQFKGGVITARNGHAGTPAYITWGKIRDAWNVERAPDGTPSVNGKNGSAGPLGMATSDEITKGDLKESTFAHGTITYNTVTHKVTVKVNGKVVPTK